MSGNFNAELYLASNPDVLNAVGRNLEAAREHYEQHGVREGRRQDFDAEDYLAANPDLIAAFHNDTTQALHHYLEYGHAEGRSTDFDAKGYLAANRDVSAATGGDENAATRHYVEHGYQEGRETGLHTGEENDHVVTITTTVPTTTSAETTIIGTAGADYYAATGSVRFQGGAGGDELKLLRNGGADKVVFTDPNDGAAGGSKHGADEIKHFQTGVDKIIVSGALRAAADHNGDGVLTGVARGANGINGGDELVFFNTVVGDLDGDGMNRIARSLGAITGAGDVLVTATHEGESALYLVHARGGAVAGSDIRMLGTFDNVRLTFGDIIAG
jgi:hypothetical protein